VSGAALQVEHLTKVFRVPTERHDSLRRFLVVGHGRTSYREFEALSDVSLEVASGEFFGIIGRNGSGKSTLLKILAGIYAPTSGSVRVEGRLSPFIELGVGFNPDLSARDNIYLNGAILGLTRRQVSAVFDDILAFAELEQFVDQKLKNYSSGMLVRLAFSVAIRAHADILLIDEVLAVGDFAFQQKCFDVFRRLKAEGRTIIFVSHDLDSVKEFCSRVLVLDKGAPVAIDSALGAIRRYYQINELHADGERDEGALPAGHAGRPHVTGVRMLDASGALTHVVRRGEAITVEVDVANPATEEIQVGVAIYRNDGLYCFGTNTFGSRISFAGKRVGAKLGLPDFPLQSGTYRLVVGVFGHDPSIVHEMLEQAYDFQVVQRDHFEGATFLTHRWERR
jgi:ABC-type polysaccharide/polyol phosphate transport system ATPase subunit